MQNIVFILTDDQTLNTIGSVNNDQIKTPNLTKLVKEGTFFTNAHFPSGTSGAMCMPSRAMIHSSRTLFELKDEGQTILNEHALLGEELLKNGYNCHGIGKWHNGSASFARSFNSGENIFFGGMWDHYNVPVCDYDYTGQYDNTIDFVVDFFSNNKPLKMTANKVNSGIHSTDLITNSAVKFLKNYQDEKPYFLYVSYLAPHDPRVTTKEFLDMYKLEDIKIPDNYKTEHPFDFGQQLERDEKLLSRPFKSDLIKSEIRDYYAMISHLDFQIGKILNEVTDDTLIVFTSDNGLCLGRHGLLGKQNHYEESVRIPLIFKGPNILKNKKIDNFVYLLDIFPTIFDYLGFKIPEVSGKSFNNMFKENVITRPDLYFAFNDYIRSYKDQDYKIIIYRVGVESEKIQIFDLKNDPYELNNLVADKKLVSKYYKKLIEYASDWELDHSFTKSFFNNQELAIITKNKNKFQR